MIETILTRTPLWLCGLFIMVMLVLACKAGVILRARIQHADNRTDDEGYLLSASLALLGLLIAFTFSLALNRYDSRRTMLVAEANAIGTAWLRAGLIEGETGKKLQQSVRDYTDLRLALPKASDDEGIVAIERRSAAHQTRLWQEMKEAIGPAPTPASATIITAFNDMFDSASIRRAERDAHIPSRVLLVLILYTAISATIIGYVLGSASRGHRIITGALFALLTLALLVILDLDRPWSGNITISQQPMVNARASMN